MSPSLRDRFDHLYRRALNGTVQRCMFDGL